MTDQTKTALLSKLRAPVADERAAMRAEYDRGFSNGWDHGNKHGRDQGFSGGVCVALQVITTHDAATIWRDIVSACDVKKMLDYAANVEPDEWELAGFKQYARSELNERKPRKRYVPTAPVASAPVAGEAQEDLAPPKCPITGRPFFMALEHPELGMVPTYGGPYDSYTIPHLGGKPDQPWHERDLRVYRYDHDLGGWIADETEVIPLRIVHEEVLHGLEDAAPQASEAVRDAALNDAISILLNLSARYRHNYDKEGCNSYHEGGADALDEAEQAIRAALSAQPGAQKEQSDA